MRLDLLVLPIFGKPKPETIALDLFGDDVVLTDWRVSLSNSVIWRMALGNLTAVSDYSDTETTAKPTSSQPHQSKAKLFVYPIRDTKKRKKDFKAGERHFLPIALPQSRSKKADFTRCKSGDLVKVRCCKANGEHSHSNNYQR